MKLSIIHYIIYIVYDTSNFWNDGRHVINSFIKYITK